MKSIIARKNSTGKFVNIHAAASITGYGMFVFGILILHTIYFRAETLLGGLGGEKDRWSENAVVLNDSLVNVVGDVLLAAGCVAYLGCFTVDVRIYA